MRGLFFRHPWVLEHLGDCQTAVHVAVEHLADQIDAIFGEREKGDSDWVVENLVHTVERILFVDNGVE